MKKLLMSAFLLLFNATSFAQVPVEISQGFDSDKLSQSVSYLIEGAGEDFTIEQVVAGLSEQFAALPEDNIAFGFLTEETWLKFELINSQSTPITRILDSGLNYLPRFHAYGVNADGEIDTLFEYNESTQFTERVFSSRNIAIPITLNPGEGLEIYFRMFTIHNLVLDLQLQTPEALAVEESADSVIIAVFSTFMLSMIAFNIIYYGLNRDRLHWLFALRETLYLVGIVHAWGFAFQFLWPSFNQWNIVAISYIGQAIVLCNLYFAERLLNVKERSTRLYRVFVTLWTFESLLVMSSTFFGARLLNIYGSLMVLATAIVIIVSTLTLLKGSNIVVRYFAVGNAVMLVGTATFGIEQFFPTLLPIEGRIIVLIAILLEAFIISAGFFARSRLFHEESMETKNALLEKALQVEVHKQETIRLERDAALAENQRLAREAAIARSNHDLRQPIFSAQLLLGLLKEEVPDKRGMLADISHSLDQLSMLATSNINEYKRETADDFEESLSVLLTRAVGLFQAQAHKASIDLRNVASSVSISVPSVPFSRIMSNLIVNAIQHSGAQKIVVGMRRRSRAIEVWVCDNGKGLGAVGDTAGDGLGLAVVKELTARHQWTLEFVTHPNKGTLFKIRIPFALSLKLDPPVQRANSLKTKTKSII